MITILLVALFQSTAPVSSFTSATAGSAKAAAIDKDEVICRKQAVLGTRLKTMVCSPPSQARQRAIDDRDLVEKAQVLQTIRDPASGPPP